MQAKFIYRHKKETKRTCSKSEMYRLQLHPKHLVHAQTLPHAQVKHDLFTATWDGIGTDIPVQTLDLAALTTTAITETTKDLTGLASSVFKGSGGLGLETGNGTTQLEHSFGVVHTLALEHDVLQPVVGGFDLARHVGELQTNDGVVDETLAKGLALVGILNRLFVADTGKTDALNYNTDSLVVEVGHDDWKEVSGVNILTVPLRLPLNPWFSFPRRFSTGTLTSSKVT